ncbi:unnamed protein product [Medioppia subpectinata]|uniref:Uncharacterized protein n=1 Tax=Medioppia subpectinata TaxID=1979941 RepID=A0A7R9Q0Q6_9ACAR|nr:unnamed protein product [Medioppia subpectinata]CAG2107573.1 unnamed protein product [Medioppia subpectinata]
MAKSGEFAEFVAEYVVKQEYEDIDEKEMQILAKLRQTVKPLIEKQLSVRSNDSEDTDIRQSISRNVSTSESNKDHKCIDKDQEEVSDETKGKLIDKEVSAKGSIKSLVYKKYVEVFGPISLAFIIITFIMVNIASAASGLWLSEWSNDSMDSNTANDTALRYRRLWVYAAIGGAEAVALIIAQIWLRLRCVRAGQVLHNQMMARVVRAPMSYFDTTPMGRILNRFSQEMGIVDGWVMHVLSGILVNSFALVLALGMLSLETPLVLLAIGPIIIVYIVCQRVFIASSRQIKRLESDTRSPIISHLSESFNGTASIRAFGADHWFVRQSYRRIDANNQCWYLSFCAEQWMSVRLEFLGSLIVFVSVMAAVIFRDQLSPGLAALAINYSLNLTLILSTFIRSVNDSETTMISIEKCLELTQIPEEAEWYNEKTKPATDWPTMGCISFTDYCTKYRFGLDLVLKDIAIDMKGRQRVGIVGRTGAGKSSLAVAIVGRTGAGKSSLALALFRLIEPTAGTVTIDGVDCSTIGLQDLRSRLTIIPQDPALFSGSLRYNLDPLVQYSDLEIWRALESAHLKTFVESLERGLNHDIAENGENLSAGQKQLVCLARALLRRTRVLVLDEATAVIVLNNGSIAESGTPEQLLADNTSIFYSMAKQEKLV